MWKENITILEFYYKVNRGLIYLDIIECATKMFAAVPILFIITYHTKIPILVYLTTCHYHVKFDIKVEKNIEKHSPGNLSKSPFENLNPYAFHSDLRLSDIVWYRKSLK